MKATSRTRKKIGRIFSPDKLVDSRTLNLAGIQIPRILIARLLARVQNRSFSDDIREKVEDLRHDGIIVWTDFLPEAEFQKLTEEIRTQLPDFSESASSSSAYPEYWNSGMAGFSASRLPQVNKFFENSKLLSTLEVAANRPLNNLAQYTSIQLLFHEPYGSSQTTLHSDIWFSAYKVWFFLDDVKTEDGPFVYVKGSHRLTATQLSYVYRSCRKKNAEGSRLISSEELTRQGLEETAITCSRNTLVIANTSGYHRRLPRDPGARRLSLHMSLRFHPFIPYHLKVQLSRYPRFFRLLQSTLTSHVAKKDKSIV